MIPAQTDFCGRLGTAASVNPPAGRHLRLNTGAGGDRHRGSWTPGPGTRRRQRRIMLGCPRCGCRSPCPHRRPFCARPGCRVPLLPIRNVALAFGWRSGCHKCSVCVRGRAVSKVTPHNFFFFWTCAQSTTSGAWANLTPVIRRRYDDAGFHGRRRQYANTARLVVLVVSAGGWGWRQSVPLPRRQRGPG